MWLASPTASYYENLIVPYYYGDLSHAHSEDYYNGLRPIDCLKSGVQLQKQSDGSFMIM